MDELYMLIVLFVVGLLLMLNRVMIILYVTLFLLRYERRSLTKMIIMIMAREKGWNASVISFASIIIVRVHPNFSTLKSPSSSPPSQTSTA